MQYRKDLPNGYRTCYRCRKPVRQYSAKGNDRRYCSPTCRRAMQVRRGHIRRVLREYESLDALSPMQLMRKKNYERELQLWDQELKETAENARQRKQ
nr:MAG TPA: DNA gyrase subunit A [Caudoviricetes sp.]